MASGTWREPERGWEWFPVGDRVQSSSSTDKSWWCKWTESGAAFSHPSPGILVQPGGFQMTW